MNIIQYPSAANISIHAPPRGATVRNGQGAAPLSISIHAPPRGATQKSQKNVIYPLFQFTPLREGRLVVRGKQRR